MSDKILVDADGKVLVDTDGKARTITEGDPCCCGSPPDCCPLCLDGTPQTLTCVIAGSALINGCVACGDMGSMSGPGGNFDGTYTLTYNPAVHVGDTTSCCWTGTVTKTIDLYPDAADCTENHTTITSFDIRLCLFQVGVGSQWFFEIAHNVAGETVQLFVTSSVDGDGCAMPSLFFNNDCNGRCGFGTFYAGDGGTAAITREVTNPFIPGCEPVLP